MIKYQIGDIIILQQRERHRLIGLDNLGVAATAPLTATAIAYLAFPSEENDIIRVQDDYNRK